MDKKDKKRTEVLRSHLQRLRQQLSGAQQQQDDLEELQILKKQIVSVETELQLLTGGRNSKPRQ